MESRNLVSDTVVGSTVETNEHTTENVVKKKRKANIHLLRLILVVALLVIWEMVSGRLIDKFWISSPVDIIQALYKWALSGELFFHLTITFEETILGFLLGAIGGGIFGFFLGRWSLVAKVLDPFITALYSLPKVALAPLFILWFGIGIEMKIILAAVIVFFLVFFNTYAGVKDVDDDLLDNIRLMGASEKQIIMKVILPSALNWIFVGLKLSVPYALIGAVVGEITASNRGIGFLISYSAGQFNTAGTFAALVVLMLLSVFLNFLISLAEKRLLRWKKQTN